MDHSDPRGFTVTGGLPYYGQFACSAGALVRMVELLREDREAFGLVTGNGAQPDASACLASKREASHASLCDRCASVYEYVSASSHELCLILDST